MGTISRLFRHTTKYVAFALLVLTAKLAAYEGRVLVVKPEGAAFESVFQGLEDDIGEDIEFIPQPLQTTSTESLPEILSTQQPDMIVLLGNEALNVFREYSKHTDALPPILATAALYLDSEIAGMSNITGIRYEIPLVTTAVGYRGLNDAPLTKVGVIYRQWMESNIQENIQYCEPEGIEIVSYVLPNDSVRMQWHIRRGLRSLIDQDVDAIWVLNDNRLLNPASIVASWKPTLSRHDLPVFVGVEPLVESKLDLGTYAVVPDHYELGVQLANMVASALDEEWDISDIDIEEPLSTISILNTRIAEQRGHIFDSNKLGQIGRRIER